MLFIILFVILLILVYRNFLYRGAKNPRVDVNGFQLEDVFTENEVNLIREYAENNENKKAADYIKNSPKVNDIVVRLLGPDYVFPDYSLILKKSLLSSCHRDDNGSFTNKNSLYPSYTMMVFLKPMKNCLLVLDKSHTKKEPVYVTQPPENIKCSPGQMLLFDSNLVHAGAFNDRIDNTRVQLKLVHRDDIDNHPELKNYHKEINRDKNPTLFSRLFDQNLSCAVPYFSDNYRFEKTGFPAVYERWIYGENLNL